LRIFVRALRDHYRMKTGEPLGEIGCNTFIHRFNMSPNPGTRVILCTSRESIISRLTCAERGARSAHRDPHGSRLHSRHARADKRAVVARSRVPTATVKNRIVRLLSGTSCDIDQRHPAISAHTGHGMNCWQRRCPRCRW
jgi:hypothetical protein